MRERSGGIAQNPAGYAITGDLKATGLAGMFKEFQSHSTARGRLASTGAQPEAYNADVKRDTGELDEANEAVVLDALRELRDEGGSTVVLVTHSPSVAGAADRVIELRDGRVAA